MYENIGKSLGTDYFRIADQLTRAELDYLRRTREFVDDEVLPVINGYWERAEFPWPLIHKLGKLGILGVQAGLAMQSIAMLGSQEQKQRWLPGMAALDKLGAFALTEPTHGSDSVALETSAPRDGDEWVINGQKKWIGNGTLADVVVVWARDVADQQVKGFLVEKGTSGYDARRIDGKGALRAGGRAARSPPPPCGCQRKTGCPARTASRTPDGCSPGPATRSPGRRSVMPPRRTRS